MKLVRPILCIILAAALFAAASCTVLVRPSGSSSGQTVTDETESTEPERTPYPYVTADGLTDPLKIRAAKIIDPAINAGIDALNEYRDPRETEVYDYEPEKDRRYDDLNETAKAVYRTMYEAVCAFEPYEVRESDLGTANPFGDVIDAVYAIYHDDPVRRLYWADGGDALSHYPRYFTANDELHPAENLAAVRADYDLFCAVFDRILDSVPADLTNYRKCIFFAAVISAACTYDDSKGSNMDPFQAYDALVVGEAVCKGYTEAFELLCHAAGINCRSLEGRALGSPDKHIWNVIETAEGRRYVDVTWTDAEIEESGRVFWSEYFMIDEQMMLNSGYQPDWETLE